MRGPTGRIRVEQGFSLVEIVVVIVLLSIVSVGLIDFITNSAGGYASTARRNQLSSAGRVVFDRISMELHNALPFSVRMKNGVGDDQCIEFLPTMAATNYVNPRFRPAAVSSSAFDVIDIIPDQVGETGRYAVIYPTDPTDLYKDTYTTTEAIFEVTISDADTGDGTQELDPTGDYRFTYRSPDERLFITTEPVSFCVFGSRLYRYSNYGFHALQLIPHDAAGTCASAECLPKTTPDRVLLTDQIDNSVLSGRPFDYLATTRRRNGVIQIELNFSEAGQSVRLNHEVLQQAAP